ncbi:phosphatidate phosphatase PAH2 isoform X1 [Ricinus communis]|uniref:phosphatidate phosphatase PAH2 isoform X1 n=1 Tax=Ricinus communis TaxID=3988 RepID=UPI00077213FC|nr:phosphatidate phosphatase PAH2 isoform X1 [Ricinus communis]XP_015575148.2 phosphatidate phosphatase PAH2 isoform X1 [Ricinus communis]XP_015575154.2 phosphatidate phosphatase PAH2 isoform X1 [Ricinus communis]XP_015575161.2 phosphatidate phosphatase PAH2 isoform X1 [Ricinus communis]XP_025012606.2 phosphatidate phosphatase PAH2 isoform X1 [Ricinus communis]XP_048226879.1 phosphatidate phosphatase PAH2 isoform X1 [Ricinus communis]|eukprot:XP_015575165.1 phosphatidate phosphatase PAH2 isoform X2 [Ricinus communis]
MYAVGRLGSYITRGVYTVSGPFHPFGGAVDIIVVEQPDGSFKSSPWYVRFGKFQGVLKAREKVVNISVNGVDADFHMYLDQRGQAYFLREVEGEERESVSSSSGDDTDEQSQKSIRPVKSKSCNYDDSQLNAGDQFDESNRKIVSRSNSRRSRIFGLVFGRRSMKEDGYQDEGDGSVSSLERAEIAANLLDVKWSTNLDTSNPRKDNVSRFSTSDAFVTKLDKDRSTNHGQSQLGLSLQDTIETSVDQYTLAEATGSCNVQMDNDFQSGFENQEFPTEEPNVELSSLRTTKQIVKTSIMDESALEEKLEISEMSGNIAEDNLQDTDQDENVGAIISKIIYPDKKFNDEWVTDERNVALTEFDISEEKSQNSIVGLDVSKEQFEETKNLTSGGPEEFHFDAKALHVTTELIPEDRVTQQAEKVELDMLHIDCFNNNHQETNPSPSRYGHDELNFEVPLAVSDSYTKTVTVDPILGFVEVESNSISTISGFSNSVNQIQNEINVSDKIGRKDLQPSLNSVGAEQLNGDGDLTKAVSVPVSESSEDEQFLFSDLDDLKYRETGYVSTCPVSNKEACPSSCPAGTNEVNGPFSTNDECNSSQESFHQTNQLADIISIGNSKVASSPISISKLNSTADTEIRRRAESLPDIWSRIDNLGTEDVKHPLSHSLDTNSKSLDWNLHYKDESRFISSDTDNENQSSLEHSNKEESHRSEDIRSAVVNPAVEISLCKHLLYEGMGAEAASQAFDAEKLDIDKFNSIGPTVVKNDRLIVRIGGHYFPWDAAAPIVLGMVTFGSEIMFEPKGMISVDQVQKSLVGDPSSAIVTTGEGWRIWPFSFRRSRSRKAGQPTLTETGSSDADNVSDNKLLMDNEKTLVKPKALKKIVRANTPTSEELASLNLKEGSNVITFTFSTAMLGRQKVDARIYLWKWNTRIVISDVDGTITRSDVLGQFMPLVGVDWSQTGVAHLFSAIKENGYQLLFLSARAISQAYITRQFLVNLKQDGKALPDGPVVISPDGLFPSLFREVIRRAPHEFKIACLEDIKALFPPDCSPFYAGFGNRDTDEISYLKVGIPKGKIFIINPKGEVAVNRRVDTKSYTSLHDLVHGMFPVMTSSEQEDFNSWNFWKLPPPDIDF